VVEREEARAVVGEQGGFGVEARARQRGQLGHLERRLLPIALAEAAG
jgi:hypothetical protein